MKMLMQGSLVLFVLTAGCVGEAPHSVQMSLSAGGDGRLTLDGAPADPSYRASYSNPRAIERMDVSLSGTGRLIGVCRTGGAVVPCGDVPFFSRVEITETGRIIRAWDLHGHLVVVYNCVGGPDVCGNDNAAEADEDDDSDDDGACEAADEDADDDEAAADDDEAAAGDMSTINPTGGTGTTDTTGCADDDDDDDGPGDDSDGETGTPPADCPAPPTDCAALQTWAHDCLCTVVNAHLVEFGVAYTLDCASLDGTMEVPEADTDYDGDIACQDDLIGEEGENVEEIAEGCPEAEVAVNNWISAIDYDLRSQGYCGHSPLILDLGGDGVALTTLEDGTRFDLLGDGRQVECSWISGDDVLLVRDLDGNGRVDGATELFGTSTGFASWTDGFAALADLDADRNGRLDAADPAFAELRILTATGELATLESAGVGSLGLDAVRQRGKSAWDGRGNRIPLVGDFERTDGTRAALVDAWLRYRP